MFNYRSFSLGSVVVDLFRVVDPGCRSTSWSQKEHSIGRGLNLKPWWLTSIGGLWTPENVTMSSWPRCVWRDSKTTHLRRNGRSGAPCCRIVRGGPGLGWSNPPPRWWLGGPSCFYSILQLLPTTFWSRFASENSTTQFCWEWWTLAHWQPSWKECQNHRGHVISPWGGRECWVISSKIVQNWY